MRVRAILLNGIKLICPDGQKFRFSEIVSSPKIKNISLFQKCKSWHLFGQPGPHEGRFAIVTMRWAGAAMDALASGVFFAPDENAEAYGEVVWSWRRDAGVKPVRSKLLRGDGDNKPAPPGRARSKP